MEASSREGRPKALVRKPQNWVLVGYIWGLGVVGCFYIFAVVIKPKLG